MKSTHLAILLLGVFSLSCQNDFLTLAPQTDRNELTFYRTADDYKNALVGGYTTLRASGLYGSSLIWMGEISTDNTDYGQTRQANNVDNFQFIDRNYTALNTIVYAAWRDHYVGLRRVNAILNRIGGASIPENLKNQYTGEAQFLRALFYFDLVRLFGDVPLLTDEITNPDGASNLTRTSSEAVYELIINDLKSAEQKLPAQYGSTDIGRATQGAAKALLGKVYLTRREWANASTKLKEVVAGGRYQLLPNYADVFSFATPTNAEILFNVQYKSGNTGQGSNFWANFTPWGIGTVVLGPNVGQGLGINRPLPDLINAYEPGDKRKTASIQTSYTATNGSVVNEPFVIKYKQTGTLASDSDVDFPVLRYADVLLMIAEANNETAFNQESVTLLNQVRQRAGLTPTKATDQASLRLAIENERRVELAFENQRWFDLVRKGRYVEVMRAKGLKVNDFNTLFIIPQREIDLNKNLTQNPGY
nr:RagB/SusD family nutrient uptake outer membrane protein [uncultured Arsenicibacter sp.]